MNNLFTRKTLDNGINLYTCSTDKFKTITICAFIHQNLEKDTATKTALLPFVLKRGSCGFPSSRLINRHLEELYGADFGGDIIKKGERQIIQFFIEMVNPRHAGAEDKILDEGLKLFKDVVLNPVTEGSGFREVYVEQEKDVLRRNIESLFNDKFNYAIERCFQEMCKDEPFSIYKYGSVSDLPEIDGENLYGYYKTVMSSSPMDIFVLGEVDEEQICEKFNRLFSFERQEKKISTSIVIKDVERERFVEEKQDVNQGKLSMGFRTGTRYGDEDFYALMVFNSILGGGPHSKLFQNVREKESLAYYAFSRLEKNKGLMLVSCGIDFNKLGKTIDIIKKQIKDIKEGRISDYEFESSRKSLINSYREAADSPPMIISLYLDGIINGVEESIEEIIAKIQRVTKEDVVRVAGKVTLDTVYFLNKK
ncbi:EF-P 5-aminopentanol modification-associated protein YfmF [Thermosediminibacter litoriperuensis]|uniref:EF-P 5-aminopentanol modification-associated protein YfmF n=1 Tax=Thermosediminibacter litoriperuensis TaxID=291989 RepID=UPI001FECFD49|nr:pitrilysin family protein [Thermosediminibacter litoriperuensis]